MQASVKHSEFFFTEHLKRETLKRLKFGPILYFGLHDIKRKGYSEGLYQIENTPEVAPHYGEDALEDSVF